jgi:hypothetical protein
VRVGSLGWFNKDWDQYNLEHSDLDISLDSWFVDFTCVTTLEDDSDSEQDTDLEEDIFVDPTDNVLQYRQHMNDEDIF